MLALFDESDGSQKSVKFVLSGAAYDVNTDIITFSASTYGDDFAPESIGQARRSLNAERYSEAFRVVGRTALAAVEQEPGTATARAVGEGISAVSRASVSAVTRSEVDAPAPVAPMMAAPVPAPEEDDDALCSVCANGLDVTFPVAAEVTNFSRNVPTTTSASYVSLFASFDYEDWSAPASGSLPRRALGPHAFRPRRAPRRYLGLL